MSDTHPPKQSVLAKLWFPLVLVLLLLAGVAAGWLLCGTNPEPHRHHCDDPHCHHSAE